MTFLGWFHIDHSGNANQPSQFRMPNASFSISFYFFWIYSLSLFIYFLRDIYFSWHSTKLLSIIKHVSLVPRFNSNQFDFIRFLNNTFERPTDQLTHSCHDYQPPKIYIFIYRYICICHTCNIHFSCLYLIYTDI